MRSRAASPQRLRRERWLAWLFSCALAACTAYDQALLDDARASGGSSPLPGSGGSDAVATGGTEATPSGGDGSGATGGEADGPGGSGSAGRAGNAGSSGTSGTDGSAGMNGDGPGAGGDDANDAGQGGTGDAGAGGEAGCNAPTGCDCESDACAELSRTLAHRYDFAGDGTNLTDSVGARDGEIVGTALGGDGSLVLAGGAALEGETLQHVALPGGCLDGLVNATFEMWFDWDVAGPSWQRIFDFGELSSDTTGTSFWFSPLAGTGTSASSRVGFSGETPGTGYTNQILVSGPALATGVRHVAVVIDDDGDMLTLYVDGAFAGAQALPRTLANVNDVNCWLGRSQDVSDPYFAGSLDEFRIYAAALGAEAITFSFEAGPNPPFFGP